jgi:hypothetical protein
VRLAILLLVSGLVACKKPPDPRYVQLAVSYHGCARRADGRVVCWGENRHHQLGVPEGAGPSLVPFVHDAVDIAVAPGTSCAVVSGGEVECWGIVWSKGEGDRQRIPGVRGALRVLMADFRACAFTAEGTESCWGPGDPGHMGLGGWPPAPDSLFRGAIRFAGQHELFCAQLTGTFRCLLPSGDRLEFRAEEVAVTYAENKICRLSEGKLSCGWPDRMEEARPTDLHNLVASGPYLCGLGSDGVLKCLNTFLLREYQRWERADAIRSPKQLAGGDLGVCALTAEGRILCWDPARQELLEIPQLR